MTAPGCDLRGNSLIEGRTRQARSLEERGPVADTSSSGQSCPKDRSPTALSEVVIMDTHNSWTMQSSRRRCENSSTLEVIETKGLIRNELKWFKNKFQVSDMRERSSPWHCHWAPLSSFASLSRVLAHFFILFYIRRQRMFIDLSLHSGQGPWKAFQTQYFFHLTISLRIKCCY